MQPRPDIRNIVSTYCAGNTNRRIPPGQYQQRRSTLYATECNDWHFSIQPRRMATVCQPVHQEYHVVKTVQLRTVDDIHQLRFAQTESQTVRWRTATGAVDFWTETDSSAKTRTHGRVLLDEHAPKSQRTVQTGLVLLQIVWLVRAQKGRLPHDEATRCAPIGVETIAIDPEWHHSTGTSCTIIGRSNQKRARPKA